MPKKEFEPIQALPTTILEDGDAALFEQSVDDPAVEYVDLTKPAADQDAPAPVVVKPAPVVAAPVVVPAVVDDADIPEDLKGKTPSQLAKMYQDARRQLGRQSNELGEVRRLADAHIKASLEAITATRQAAAAPVVPAKPKTKEERDVEFFANPSESMARAVEEHPVVKEAREATQRMIDERKFERAMNTKAAFDKAYPDALAIVKDPEFQQWIGASKVRTSLLHTADKDYDLDAAQEIFGGWKERQAAQAAAKPAALVVPAVPAKPAPAAGAVPSGGGAGAAPAIAPGKPGATGRIYRRSEVLALMTDNPKKYNELVEDIQLAYAQGRVR